MKSIKKLAISVRESLNHPGKIMSFCLLFFVLTLSLNGVPLRLWGLYRDIDRYEVDSLKKGQEIRDLERRLAEASDPAFIEKQAKDRLDLVGENDLLFVFPTQ